MLMEVRNQLRVTNLSIKYSLMKNMLNKFSFITNIVFMILNNATMIIQWVILFNLKENFGGYTFKAVLLLWGFSSLTYGVSHFFFKNAYSLSELITDGKLDAYLVQPKNVLISAITSDIEVSAIGDMLYGYILLFVYGFSIKGFLLFTLFGITGGLLTTALSIIMNSLSFWFTRTDMIADEYNHLMINFSTYPDSIFKGITKIILYTFVPVGISTYIPVKVLLNFNIYGLILNVLVTVFLIVISFIIFNRGLRRYSGTNIMSSRI